VNNKNNVTTKERLVRLEVMMTNHLEHHRVLTKLLVGITAASVSGFFMSVLPGFVRWLAQTL